MSMRSRLLNDVVDPPVQDIEPGGIDGGADAVDWLGLYGQK